MTDRELAGIGCGSLFLQVFNSNVELGLVCFQDTDRFCREVLCDPGVIAVLGENLVCWGGDVRQSEAFRVSQMME